MTIFYTTIASVSEGMTRAVQGRAKVIFADSPYNLGKAESKVPKYDQSESLANQKWTDFHAAWDVIDDYDQFCLDWLEPARDWLADDGSLFSCGTFHNTGAVQQALKRLGMHTVQWISWCIPNSFPQRKMQQMVSANQVIIWARKKADHLHHYNVERAKDWAVLDYYRLHGELPMDHGKLRRTNLRDYWIINNDPRAVAMHPFLKAHMAKKPPELVARCIDIATPDEGEHLIIDPFLGSGTTGWVVDHINDWVLRPRTERLFWVGIEQFGEYARMSHLRTGSPLIWNEGWSMHLPESNRKAITPHLREHADFILYGVNPQPAIPKIEHKLIVPAQVRNALRGE